MNDKFDPMIDKAIEAEKQQALREFHRHPIIFSSGESGHRSSQLSVMWASRNWLWTGCAVALFLTLGVVTLLHYKSQPADLGVTNQVVEQALLSIRRIQGAEASRAPVSFGGDKAASDLTWNIQSAVCRLQRSHYARQDLTKAILRTLSRGAAPYRTGAGLEKEVVHGLDGKLQKLSSTKAVSRAFSRISR